VQAFIEADSLSVANWQATRSVTGTVHLVHRTCSTTDRVPKLSNNYEVAVQPAIIIELFLFGRVWTAMSCMPCPLWVVPPQKNPRCIREPQAIPQHLRWKYAHYCSVSKYQNQALARSLDRCGARQSAVQISDHTEASDVDHESFIIVGIVSVHVACTTAARSTEQQFTPAQFRTKPQVSVAQ
jgi:hypothetical protein